MYNKKVGDINKIKVRMTWEDYGFQGTPQTKVIANKKGKGSYQRREKHEAYKRNISD